MASKQRNESGKIEIGWGASIIIIIIVLIPIIIAPAFFEKRSEEKRLEQQKIAAEVAKKKERDKFVKSIEEQYQKLVESYKNNNFELASKQLALFGQHQELHYKDVRDFEERIRIGMIRKLEKEVKPIPASKAADNLRIYRQLLELDPENPKYKKKVSFYRVKVKEEREKKKKEYAKRPSKADMFIYVVASEYQYKDHYDSKCDICGKSVGWSPVRGKIGKYTYEWCYDCGEDILRKAKSF